MDGDLSTMDKRSVLVVDDDSKITAIIEECLESFNYDLKVVSSGQEALDKIEDPSISLVLLDVNLPDISGLDVLTILQKRNSSGLPHPVITPHFIEDCL